MTMNEEVSAPPRILVPLDESEFAESALALATRIAKASGGRVTLLTVPRALGNDMSWYYEAMSGGSGVPVITGSLDEIVAESAEAAKVYLAEVSGRLEAEGLDVETIVGETQPHDAIVDAAESIDADLIIMATHGRGGVGRWALGSVATKVLQSTPRPVLVVRAGADADVSELERIDVALDGSQTAEQVLPIAARLAGWLRLPLRLLHVIPRTHDRVHASVIDAHATILKSAEAYLQRVREDAARWNAVVTHHILTGDDEAQALLDADPGGLLALTSHGRGDATRWLFGSIADRVVRHATRPVLVLRKVDG